MNVWQTRPFKIKSCTETVAYHYSLHMLQKSTAVDAVCTKKPGKFQLHLNIKGVFSILKQRQRNAVQEITPTIMKLKLTLIETPQFLNMPI